MVLLNPLDLGYIDCFVVAKQWSREVLFFRFSFLRWSFLLEFSIAKHQKRRRTKGIIATLFFYLSNSIFVLVILFVLSKTSAGEISVNPDKEELRQRFVIIFSFCFWGIFPI
jgi:hypothetical protein